ncbi:MAG: amidohydrolase, partial [Rhizomicrobium sp.]
MRDYAIRTIGISSVILAAFCGPARAAPVRADVVYLNGKIFTADAKDRVVQGFAVTGSRFIAAGDNAALRKFIGKGTRVV